MEMSRRRECSRHLLSRSVPTSIEFLSEVPDETGSLEPVVSHGGPVKDDDKNFQFRACNINPLPLKPQ